MSLTSVKMSEEVWLTCMTHALSTETEEIMGLLLGDIQYSKGGSATASIWGASPQTRSDRRKDRVETNPEQLAAASAMAERMTAATGTTTRVIGWYHSHPHITVLPSHVDVRTQAMYQLLESGFIGLIFSCFNEDAHKVGRIQVIAFQSLDGKQSQAQRPASLSPVKRSTVIDIGPSLSSLDDTSTKLSSGKEERLDQDINDSNSSGTKAGGRSSDLEGYFAHADANYRGIESTRNQGPETASTAYVDIEPMDMSDGMQEAMLRSNMDMSGAEYIQKEVPLQLLPASSLLQLKSPSASFIDLQHVLYQEEKAAYNLAISQNMRDGKGHPLTFIHHTATYQASMCKLMEYCLSPAIDAMQQRARENEIRLAMLAEEAKVLEAEVESNALQLAAGSSHHSDVA